MHPVDQVKKAELFRPEAAKKLAILKQKGFLLTLMAFVLHPIVPEVFSWCAAPTPFGAKKIPHAPLLACLLYRRFPVHIHLYPDVGHLNGSICQCIKDITIKSPVQDCQTDRTKKRKH